MAAQVMKEGRVQLVVVGADRIAANGDTANKIGTYGVAVLAKAHGIPFYVAAPSSTFDLTLPTATAIPIEQRDPREVTHGFGRQTAPDGVAVYNPAFDVTPARLIAGHHHREGTDPAGDGGSYPRNAWRACHANVALRWNAGNRTACHSHVDKRSARVLTQRPAAVPDVGTRFAELCDLNAVLRAKTVDIPMSAR